MFTIAIPQEDVSSLNGDGCNVKINNQPTVIRREGDYLCYGENRCKILDEQCVGDNVDFIAASHGAEDEPHVILHAGVSGAVTTASSKAASNENQGGEAMADTTTGPDQVTGTPIDEYLRIHSGEANAKAPHLAVPLYMPLAPNVKSENALCAIEADEDLSGKAKQGKIELIAIAYGTMNCGDGSESLGLMLYKDRQGYWTYSVFGDEVESAVLVDGDGRRYLSGRKLPREEAVRRWISGFLNWNCECPGLYRLRYAMIERPTTNKKDTSTTSE